MFGQHGFDRVTIKQLADACKITEPALYRYFSSKEEIYGAVLDSLKSHQRYRELFAKLETEDDLHAILHELASHILSFLHANRDVYRLLLYSTLREHTKARQVFRDVRGPYVKFLVTQLDRLHKQGRIKTKNNVITARCFIGMVFDCALGSTLWRGFLGKNYQPEEIITNNVAIFVDGLRIHDLNGG